jgi:hypothetical protein
LRQQIVDSMFDNGMRLPTANFHNHPWFRLNTVDFLYDLPGDVSIAVFVEIFHRRFPSCAPLMEALFPFVIPSELRISYYAAPIDDHVCGFL